MSSRTHVFVRRKARLASLLFAWGITAVAFAPCHRAEAQNGQKASGTGRLESATGTLLRREGANKEWKAVVSGTAVSEGEVLLALPGAHATILSNNGAIRMVLWGNVPQESQTPALESAVTLQRSSDADTDVLLDRGRILVTNTKEKGPATVRLRARKQIWDLILAEPGTAASVEFNARWAPGMPYKDSYEEGEEPKAEMILLIVKGAVELKAADEHRTLRAPPGPALFSWDSVGGLAPTPHALEKLPPWAEPGADKDAPAAAVREAIKPLISALASKPANAALTDLLAAGNNAVGKEKAELIRELAVTGFGAIDDFAGLFKALGDEKDATVRRIAIEALRHWIGRKAGQDAAIARFLVREQKYSPDHAAAVLQLLHSPGKKSIEDPLTYEVLIAYLQHDKLPIRELAAFQLYRLAPAGGDIRYDPAASKEKREEAVKQWKKLVPSGELPPAPKQK